MSVATPIEPAPPHPKDTNGHQHVVFDSGAHRMAYRIVKSSVFDYVMGAIILFNMVVIVIETDQAAADEGGEKGATGWQTVSGFVILIIFVAELILRIYAFRANFWKDEWNTFDFFVVVTDTVFTVAGLMVEEVFPVSAIRIFRLCKLARVSKVFRVFPELRLMMAGLLGSIRAIFWGTVLLGFVLTVWSIMAVQLVHPLNKNIKYEDCERCPRAYSSVMQCILTFSQQIVAGDSWGQATIPLIEEHPVTGIFFMVVFLSVGMAVLNLILGVVVNVAQRAHDDLKEEIEKEKNMLRMETNNHLLGVCEDMDKDGSGELSKEEIFEGYRERPEFRNTLQEMDLGEEDLQIVWVIMDSDRSGKVSYVEFVSQVYKLKNSDTQFMLAYIKYYITIIKNSISDQMQIQQDQMLAASAKVETEMAKVEGEIEALVDGERDVMLTSLQRPVSGQSGDTISKLAQIAPAQDHTLVVEMPNAHFGTKDDNVGSGRKIEVGVRQGYTEVPYREIPKEPAEFQRELRHAIQDIQTSLEIQASNTSKLLLELLPNRQSGVLASATRPQNSSSRLCCMNGASVQTVIVPHDDFAAEAPPSNSTTTAGPTRHNAQPWPASDDWNLKLAPDAWNLNSSQGQRRS